ncbi:MAG: PRC-barrel domain-containing protein [Vicinamibacteraceae bacterium]
MELHRTRDLRKCTVRASDGDVGGVEDLYFDDQHWTIRYLVVNTGGWLAGRRVLVSPALFRRVDWADQRVHIDLTRERVEKSPPVESAPPISRRYELEYFRYYGLPFYGYGPGAWGTAVAPIDLPRAQPEAPKSPAFEDVEASHVQSTADVTGYHIAATDGDIGHIDDFLFDDHTWTIRYLLVDTSDWWGGKRVLVAPAWTREVSWQQHIVTVELTRDQVKSSPPLGAVDDLTQEYERRLHAHYGRPPYWG